MNEDDFKGTPEEMMNLLVDLVEDGTITEEQAMVVARDDEACKKLWQLYFGK